MTTVLIIIMFISIITIPVSVIILIVKAIRKKRLKIWAIVPGVALLLVIVTALISGGLKDYEYAGTTKYIPTQYKPEPAPLPDLIFLPIADWEGSPMAIGTMDMVGSSEGVEKYGSTVFLFIMISNKDKYWVKDLKIKYFVDGYEVYETTFWDKPVNKSKLRVSTLLKNLSTLPGKPLSPGMHTFEIILDPDNEIAESDETNNSYLAELEVPAGYFQ